MTGRRMDARDDNTFLFHMDAHHCKVVVRFGAVTMALYLALHALYHLARALIVGTAQNVYQLLFA